MSSPRLLCRGRNLEGSIVLADWLDRYGYFICALVSPRMNKKVSCILTSIAPSDLIYVAFRRSGRFWVCETCLAKTRLNARKSSSP